MIRFSHKLQLISVAAIQAYETYEIKVCQWCWFKDYHILSRANLLLFCVVLSFIKLTYSNYLIYLKRLFTCGCIVSFVVSNHNTCRC